MASRNECHRLGRPARLPEHDGQRERRIRKRETQLGGAPKRDFGAFEVVALFQRHPVVVMRLGVAWILRDQRAQHVHGALEVAALHQRCAEIQARRVERGVGRDERAKRLHRRVAIAALQQREPKGIARVA